jgi:uracil-DNA glycosylase family 4
MTDHSVLWARLEAEIAGCRACPRLVRYREQVAAERRRAYRSEVYWGKPAPGFGDRDARILVVGLAPGAHGANRTGRLFTGDSSGDFLFGALHRAGLANQPVSRSLDDGLALHDCFVSASCRCAPPENKPARQELASCRPFLERELGLLRKVGVIVTLGRIAFEGVLDAMGTPNRAQLLRNFAHGARLDLGPGHPILLASYHPSRQNTQTGRLTQAMFDDIWRQAHDLVGDRDGEREPGR